VRRSSLAELPPAPVGRKGWPWTIADDEATVQERDSLSWPRISLVTPSFNQGAFLEETIRSVLLQGYPNLQYIVVDGGSTDSSINILRRYSPHLSYWVSEPDDGQSDAINKGFLRADGDLLGWLNSDDFLTQGALRHVAEEFRTKGPDVGALVGRGHWINRDKQAFYSPLPDHVDRASLLKWVYGCDFMQPACFFTRRAWLECGPLRTDLRYCMDLDLWLRIERKFRFAITSQTLAMANAHPAAKTVGERAKVVAETALLYASQEDGLDVARRVLTDLLEGRFSRDPTSPRKALTVGNRLLHRVGLYRTVNRLRRGARRFSK
jgi:glycosyltransferase involved in cell wall biosynthesis